MSSRIELTLPGWLLETEAALPEAFPSLEARMRLVLELAKRNFEANSGGPFAAGVFEQETGRRIALGVNRVLPTNCSSAHAEIMALSFAQQALGTFDLGAARMPPHQLVVNWRPCAMCYGAVIWSGVRSLVIAGSGPELEEITGFDEGPVHPDWRLELEKRGIAVKENVLRDEAIAVFEAFSNSGRLVYNARLGGST
jgi:tRNA(Arg) A34 adenosine deaminase TadA